MKRYRLMFLLLCGIVLSQLLYFIGVQNETDEERGGESAVCRGPKRRGETSLIGFYGMSILN